MSLQQIPPRRRRQTIVSQGLQSHSAKHALAPTEVYVGLSFRLLERDEPLPEGSEEYTRREMKDNTASQDFELGVDQRLLMWGAVISDGVGIIDSGRNYVVINMRERQSDWEEVKKVVDKAIGAAWTASRGQSIVAQVIAIAEPLPWILGASPEFLPSFWAHLNAIPFIIRPPTLLFDDLPEPSPEYYASAAVTAAIKHLHPASHSAIAVGVNSNTHEVLVDADGQIRIASLKEYEQSTSPRLWRRFMALVRHVKARNIKVVFASATPAGGGVALMRHALIRILRLVGIDATWIVPEGHPAVFNITKKHIHNVLQGVSQHNETLGPTERKYFEAWTRANWEAYWHHSSIFKGDRIVVIDDPQLAPLIPFIKKQNPTTKIIFRSHIQIQSNLTDDAGTTQHEVFGYLWEFIKQTDLFLAHPVKFFVPKCVRESDLPVLYMPPSTDPIDGLNKPLGSESVIALRDAYNNLSRAQCGVEMDWDRGYVVQVARFDPSKGLPVLLEAYLKFRWAVRDASGEDYDATETESPDEDGESSRRADQYIRRRSTSGSGRHPDFPQMSPISRPPRTRTKSYDFGQSINGFVDGFTQYGSAPKNAVGRKPPMLVVVGHGSVDDPDGSAIYEQLHRIVHSPVYSSVVDDISIVRAPPSDTLLGMLMQGAWVACQLSTREGFEVKVSEAVFKKIPVIVSMAGGLPLQVKEGVNGWLVPSGESEPVAQILLELWEGKRKLKRTGPHSMTPTKEEEEDEDLVMKRTNGGGIRGPPLVGKSDATTPRHGFESHVSYLDANTRADAYVKDIERPFPAVRDDEGSPSEDFFTVGNVARWLLLWSLLDGRGVEAGQGVTDADFQLLTGMGLPSSVEGQAARSGRDAMKQWDERAVWEMLMGMDMLEDEGVVL